jgi:hypothetical protein
VPDDVVVWRITEAPIMNEPIGHMARSCPSSDGLRRVPMSHVAMKVSVTSDLEEHHLAAICHDRVGVEAADCRFKVLNIRRP